MRYPIRTLLIRTLPMRTLLMALAGLLLAQVAPAASWVEISSDTVPPVRYGHSMTTIGSDVYVFGKVAAGEVADGYAVVRTTTSGGGLLTFASVIDNLTNDPIYIPGQQ